MWGLFPVSSFQFPVYQAQDRRKKTVPLRNVGHAIEELERIADAPGIDLPVQTEEKIFFGNAKNLLKL